MDSMSDSADHGPTSFKTGSVQILEFKTRLLEAVKELHIQRDAEVQHEAQVCTLVLEKQEMEGQQESLQNQINRMKSEHLESLAVLRKQFQAQCRALEGEKGKLQLSAELKDKEISSLKEELKELQLLKFSLEKQLSKLEQKLQVQTQVKDSHLNQLSQVETRFRTISRQCASVKQAHEKLEQNVDEAVRLNRKLASVNQKQESALGAMKKEVERLNSELVKQKVSSICRSGDESSHALQKQQQVQELEQRLTVETEVNKRLRNENAVERAEKQKIMSALQHAQWLLQTQTQAVSRTEQQLRVHDEEFEALKREHEMVQERSKEKEDRLAQLIDQHKSTSSTLQKEMQMLQTRMQADQKELKAIKEANDLLHKQLTSCMVHGANYSRGSQRNQRENSACGSNLDVRVDTTRVVGDDGSSKGPQNESEEKRRCPEPEAGPDQRSVECGDAAAAGENQELNAAEMERNVLVIPSSQSSVALAPDQSDPSDGVSVARVTDRHVEPDVEQEVEECVPTGIMCDELNHGNLSQPQTRSVYEVTDPVMPESGSRTEERIEPLGTERNPDVTETPAASDPSPEQHKDQVPHTQDVPLESDPKHNNIKQHDGAMEAKRIPESNSPRPPKSPLYESSVNLTETQTGSKPDDGGAAAAARLLVGSPHVPVPTPQEEASSKETVTSERSCDSDTMQMQENRALSPELNIHKPSATSHTPSQHTVEFPSPWDTRLIPASEHKPLLPCGFQELLTSFPKPKPRQKGATVNFQPLEMLNVSNLHPDHKADRRGDWNAIKQTFSEISAEKDRRLPISFGSAQQGGQPVRFVGNGVRQSCTVTPPLTLHILGNVARPACVASTPAPSDTEERAQSGIRAQIAKIERFLNYEEHAAQKRRRTEK